MWDRIRGGRSQVEPNTGGVELQAGDTGRGGNPSWRSWKTAVCWHFRHAATDRERDRPLLARDHHSPPRRQRRDRPADLHGHFQQPEYRRVHRPGTVLEPRRLVHRPHECRE